MENSATFSMLLYLWLDIRKLAKFALISVLLFKHVFTSVTYMCSLTVTKVGHLTVAQESCSSFSYGLYFWRMGEDVVDENNFYRSEM